MIFRSGSSRVSFGQVCWALASLVFLGSAESSYALDLMAPFSLETAQVLPVGVRNPRFMTFFLPVESRFGGGGGLEPLGQPLQRKVSWSDVIELESDSKKKMGISAILNRARLDPDGGPGETTGQVNAVINAKVPALAIGVTPRFTLAVAVPVVTVAISADAGFKGSEDGRRWLKSLCDANPVECQDAARRLNNGVGEKLAALNYQALQSKTYTNIGDVQVVGKYLLHQDDKNVLSVKSTFVLPTGTRANADDVLDFPTGDGRLQIGSSLIYDRFLTHHLRVNAFGSALALMPNQMERRIPVVSGDMISGDKETLTRDMGGVFALGTSINHYIDKLGIMTGAGYNVQFLTRTSYSGGTQFAPERYRHLEGLNPSELLHSASVMAGFSTVEWYQQKKFVYPFQANVVYSHPISGRNVASADLISGELVLFF